MADVKVDVGAASKLKEEEEKEMGTEEGDNPEDEEKTTEEDDQGEKKDEASEETDVNKENDDPEGHHDEEAEDKDEGNNEEEKAHEEHEEKEHEDEADKPDEKEAADVEESEETMAQDDNAPDDLGDTEDKTEEDDKEETDEKTEEQDEDNAPEDLGDTTEERTEENDKGETDEKTEEQDEDAQELTEEDRERFRQIFDRKAVNGRLDLKGFKVLFRLMGEVISSDEAEEMFEEGDKDNDNTIDLEEFCRLYAKFSQEEQQRKEAILESVDKLFPGKDGESVELKKVEQLLMKLQQPDIDMRLAREKSDLGEDDIKYLVRSMDADGSGFISKQEFVDMLCQHIDI